MSTPNITLPLLNVNSAHCALRVEQALKATAGVTDAKVDLGTQRATISSETPAKAVRDAVAAVRLAGYDVSSERLHFNTTGITCAGCARSAGNILDRLTGVLNTTIDQPTGTATVEVVKGTVTLEEMLSALKPAGYSLIPQAA
ncbi:MAG: cation transporter [Flavobacteriales bacterium]|nr:cation transporter [Flavobacteriales bacterium]